MSVILADNPEILSRNSRERGLLIEAFQKLKPGQAVSHDALTALIGRNVRGEAYHSMAAAIRHVRRKENNPDGEGIAIELTADKLGRKRAEGKDFPVIGTRARKKAARAARLGVSKLKCAPLATMDNALRTATLTEQGALGAMALCASESRVKKIGEGVRKAVNGKPLPSTKALEALME